jgi:hypothetical protein
MRRGPVHADARVTPRAFVSATRSSSGVTSPLNWRRPRVKPLAEQRQRASQQVEAAGHLRVARRPGDVEIAGRFRVDAAAVQENPVRRRNGHGQIEVPRARKGACGAVQAIRRGDVHRDDREAPPSFVVPGARARRTAIFSKGLCAIEGSTWALATATQLGDRRLQQEEISAWLARVERDDRTTLRGECETLRLAIQIAEPPRIQERSGAAARLEIIEPRNRGGLVTEQIEATIWTNFEITEVGADFGQSLVGKPDCQSDC